MKQVMVWRVFYTSIARVHAESAAEAMDRAHRVAGAALKRAHEITPSLANDVDIENIDMISAYFCGTEEVPRLRPRLQQAGRFHRGIPGWSGVSYALCAEVQVLLPRLSTGECTRV